jgi:integrase
VKRQCNGRSTIYQGSDGYWHGRVIVGVTDQGKPDRRHVMSRSKSVVTARVRGEETGERERPTTRRAMDRRRLARTLAREHRSPDDPAEQL